MAEPPERRRLVLVVVIAIAFFLVAVIVGVVWSAGSDESEEERIRARASRPFASAARALDELARRERGEVGYALAPLGEGDLVAGGELREGQAWSAIKVPLAAAFLTFRRETRRAASGSEGLSRSDSQLIRTALTRSSNKAAKRMFRLMAGAGDDASARARVEATLRKGGDERTRTAPDPRGATELGATSWRIEDALGWYRELARGCLLPQADTDLLLGHMRQVVPAQRWGAPAAVDPGTPVAFKSGWGPSRELVWFHEQFAIVGRGEEAYVIGLMARPTVRAESTDDRRSFRAGRKLITRAARAAHEEIDRRTSEERTVECSQ
jgi:hypothetical protein